MIVRTVLGDIRPDELGPCDAHEHLFLDTPAQPGDEFVDADKAVAEARTLVAAGGRSLVDWTPLGLGRTSSPPPACTATRTTSPTIPSVPRPATSSPTASPPSSRTAAASSSSAPATTT